MGAAPGPKPVTPKPKPKGKAEVNAVGAENAAASYVYMVNVGAMALLGPEYAMAEAEHDLIEKGTAGLLEKYQVGKQADQASAPAALVLGIGAWVLRCSLTWRLQHPPKPKAPKVPAPAPAPGPAATPPQEVDNSGYPGAFGSVLG